MAQRDFSWAKPIMQAGYGGRGLVYTVIGGFAVWAIWQGGSAGGVKEAFRALETTAGGGIVLGLIVIGMAAYALWRVLDAAFDLEDYGDGAKGAVARAGMVVTGLAHLLIGLAALTLLVGSPGGDSAGGGGSNLVQAVSEVMSWPFGIWLVGIAGALTVAAGLYYLAKAWRKSYLQHLRGNEATLRWNGLLRAGVAAQGVVVTTVGVFLISAASAADPGQAGGVGQTFSWISGHPYGRLLVTALALGLMCFALFCFVNARYRIVPKAEGGDIETLGARLKARARQTAG
jgi:hypothetical protein